LTRRAVISTPVAKREREQEASQPPDYARLARDGAVNYGGHLVAALIGFAVVPLLLHRLGAEAYGVLVVALTCAALLGFLEVGLGSSVVREVADPRSADTERFLRSAGAVFAAFGAVGALVVAGLGVVSGVLGLAPGLEETPLVFLFVGTGFFGDQLTLYNTAVFGGLRRFDLVSGMLVGSTASRAAVTVSLVLAGASVATVAAWYAASAWLWAIVNVLAVRRISTKYSFRPIAPTRAVLRSRLGFGAGSAGIMAGMGLIWNVGPLLVAAVDGAAASALYQVSQRFPLAVMALPERVSVTLFPAASEQGRAEDSASAVRLIRGGTRVIAVVLLPISILLFVTADNLLEAWLGSVPPDGALILRLTTVAVTAQALSASALQVLWGRGDVTQLAIAVAAAAGVAIAGTGALALAFGPVGAALALAIAAAVTATSVLTLGARTTGRTVRALVGAAAADLALAAGACAGVAGALTELGVGNGWLGLCVVGAASIAAYFATLMLRWRSGWDR
jgi:O-antigen/teichoic acid export membrane protein